MRHRKIGRKLGRTSSHRKALMMNLCNALIEREVIKTTLAKAKELRRFFEPMITAAKTDSVAGRRLMFSRLRSRTAVGKLFLDLGPRFKSRPGGYVRVLKCGHRIGDNAVMAIVELVERSSVEAKPEPKPASKKAKPEPKSEKVEAPKKENTSQPEPKITAKKAETAEKKAAPKKKPTVKKDTKAVKPKAKKAEKE